MGEFPWLRAKNCHTAHVFDHVAGVFALTSVNATNLCMQIFPFEIMALALAQGASSQFYPQKMCGSAQAWQTGRVPAARCSALPAGEGSRRRTGSGVHGKNGIGAPGEVRGTAIDIQAGAPGRVRSAPLGNSCACLKSRRNK